MCKLIVVTNRVLCEEDFLERIRLLCMAGVDRIVLREKDLREEEYQRLAKEVYSICREYDTECILHQFIDVALRLQADGIHVSVQDAVQHTKVLKDMRMVGVSVHSSGQLELAVASHADYVFYGHVFETACKPGVEPRGIPALKEICRQAVLPVYAIGGIVPENVRQVLDAGADGVCVMSWGMKASKEEILAMSKQCHEGFCCSLFG